MVNATIHIFAEGATDFDFFSQILRYLAQDIPNFDVTPRPRHPIWDETSGSWERGGDTRLMDFYRSIGRRNSSDINAKQIEEDAKIFDGIGIDIRKIHQRPTRSEIDITSAFEENSLRLLSIDGDCAEKISDLPQGNFNNYDDRYKYCREAICYWTNISHDHDSVVFAIPVHCLEAWFLALYAQLDAQTDIEHINTQNVYNQLIERKHPPHIDENGKTTVDKVKLVKDHSHKIIQQIDKIKGHCPSFARFIDDVRQKLESRCVHPHNE